MHTAINKREARSARLVAKYVTGIRKTGSTAVACKRTATPARSTKTEEVAQSQAGEKRDTPASCVTEECEIGHKRAAAVIGRLSPEQQASAQKPPRQKNVNTTQLTVSAPVAHNTNATPRHVTLDEIKAQSTVSSVDVTSDWVENCATTCVFRASNGVIDTLKTCAGDDRWGQPDRWHSLVRTLTADFRRKENAPCGWREMMWHGEYNAVYLLKPDAGHALGIASFCDDADGHVCAEDVVIRLTRPDVTEHANSVQFNRYKELDELCTEMRFVLHGAANGFAPKCYAAFIYPAPVGGWREENQDEADAKLYGALYILQRGERDLSSRLLSETDTCLRNIEGDPSAVEANLHFVGERAALDMMSVLYRQASAGVLNLDAKPSNYVIASTKDGREVLSIDHDVAMYAILSDEAEGWSERLLVSFILLSAHVRRYFHTTLSEGWARAARALILRLGEIANETNSWLFAARIRYLTAFRNVTLDAQDDRRRQLEAIVKCYFVRDKEGLDSGRMGKPFAPIYGPSSPCLLAQLVRYCVHGDTAFDADDDLERIFVSKHTGE